MSIRIFRQNLVRNNVIANRTRTNLGNISLLNAVEAAILHHAKTHSDWWQKNRERLCFSRKAPYSTSPYWDVQHRPKLILTWWLAYEQTRTYLGYVRFVRFTNLPIDSTDIHSSEYCGTRRCNREHPDRYQHTNETSDSRAVEKIRSINQHHPCHLRRQKRKQ